MGLYLMKYCTLAGLDRTFGNVSNNGTDFDHNSWDPPEAYKNEY